MKINGKEVIEIRPMTRYEYGVKYGIWDTMGACQFCREKYRSTFEERKVSDCTSTACSKQPVYVLGAFIMIVKVR